MKILQAKKIHRNKRSKRPTQKGNRDTSAAFLRPSSPKSAKLALVIQPPPQPSAPSTAGRGLTESQLAGMHPDLVGDVAYAFLSGNMPMSEEMHDAANLAVVSFQEQMQASDALERLVLGQLLLAHGRAAWQTKLLAAQTDPQTFGTISEGVERATGSFVRLMRAFSEYRRPSSSPSTNVSIAQANVGGNQLIQNLMKKEGGEKEKDDDQTRISQAPAASTPALRSNANRFALPAGGGSSNTAVDKKYGTKNRRGKGASADECTAPRSAVSRSHRNAKTRAQDD